MAHVYIQNVWELLNFPCARAYVLWRWLSSPKLRLVLKHWSSSIISNATKVSVLMDNKYEHSKQLIWDWAAMHICVCFEDCSLTVSLHTLVKLLYILVVLLFIGEIKERSTEEREQLVGPRVRRRVRLWERSEKERVYIRRYSPHLQPDVQNLQPLFMLATADSVYCLRIASSGKKQRELW